MSSRARSLATAASLAAAIAVAVGPAGSRAGEPSSSSGCALQQPRPAGEQAQSCAACHRAGSSSGHHPVDVDYARAASARTGGMGLRAPEEVVRRGIYLAEGKVQCLTCHDPRSPWMYHLALPPGAKPRPAVRPGDPSTYEDGPALEARAAALAAEAAGGQRPDVGRKALCLGCHAAD